MPRSPLSPTPEHWDDGHERYWLTHYSPSSDYRSQYPSQHQSNRDKALVPYNPSPTRSSTAYPYHDDDTDDKHYPDESLYDREIRYRHVAARRPLIPRHYLDSVENGYQLLQCLIKIFSSRLGQSSFAGKDWGYAQRTPEFTVVEGHWGRRKIMSSDHREVRMPQRRQAWEVSIVYNTWTVVKDKKLNQPLEQILAHWGVCFAPSNGEGLNRVYSMDFEDELGLNLVLQDTWWTSEDGWVQETYDHEMDVVVRKYRSSSATMYFSVAELPVTAQKVLDEFLRHHYDTKTMKASQKGTRAIEKHFKKHHQAWNAGTGRLYGLLSRNCQDYATYLFDNLLHQGWDDRRRLHYDWDPEIWLQELDHFEWLEVPRSKKWGRLGRIMKELTQAAAEGGAKAYVAIVLIYELRMLFYYGLY